MGALLMDKRLLLLGGGALLWYLSQEQQTPPTPPAPAPPTPPVVPVPTFSYGERYGSVIKEQQALIKEGVYGENARMIRPDLIVADYGKQTGTDSDLGVMYHANIPSLGPATMNDILSGGKAGSVTQKEFALFCLLVEYWNKVYTPEAIKRLGLPSGWRPYHAIIDFSLDEILAIGWLQTYIAAIQHAGVFKVAGDFTDKLIGVGVGAVASLPAAAAAGLPGWIVWAVANLGNLLVQGLGQLTEGSNIKKVSDAVNDTTYRVLGPPPTYLDDLNRFCVAHAAAIANLGNRIRPNPFDTGAMRKALEAAINGRFEYQCFFSYWFLNRYYRETLLLSAIPIPPLNREFFEELSDWGEVDPMDWRTSYKSKDGIIHCLSLDEMMDGPLWGYYPPSKTFNLDAWRDPLHQGRLEAAFDAEARRRPKIINPAVIKQQACSAFMIHKAQYNKGLDEWNKNNRRDGSVGGWIYPNFPMMVDNNVIPNVFPVPASVSAQIFKENFPIWDEALIEKTYQSQKVHPQKIRDLMGQRHLAPSIII